jgi:hypothetical protein
MIKIFLLFLLLLIISITQYTEIIDARHECHLQRKKDVALLNREVCLDQTDRLHFKGMVDCASAESRLRMNIPLCTIKTWLSKTDLVTIYNKVTDSYWNILGFVLPILFIILHYWQKDVSERRLTNNYLRLREK